MGREWLTFSDIGVACGVWGVGSVRVATVLAQAVLTTATVPAPPGSCNIPVYRTQSRQHFVFAVPLRTKDPVGKWVLAGVILVLEIK